jgi:hypothetical protein
MQEHRKEESVIKRWIDKMVQEKFEERFRKIEDAIQIWCKEQTSKNEAFQKGMKEHAHVVEVYCKGFNEILEKKL